MSSNLGWFALATAAAVFIVALLSGSQSPSIVGEVGGPPDPSRRTMTASDDDDQRRHQANGIATGSRPTTYAFSDLSGESIWRIVSSNGSISIIASVPGTVHTALLRTGFIGDPYYRFNDDAYRWVSYDSWAYSRLFTVSDEEARRQAARIVCDGLDTIATVYVNSIEVGKSSNQFVGYVFDVTNVIQPGVNSIRIAFDSAVTYSKNAFDSHPYLVPPTCPPAEYHPECHANFIRKAQCSFSWDWGPAFPTQGIWKGIGLETFNGATIRSVTPYPFKDADGWKLNVTVYFDVASQTPGVLEINIDELRSSTSLPLTVSSALSVVSTIVAVNNAELWWPRGYGAPKLYTVKITFTSTDWPTEPSTVSVKTGFRTVELVQDVIDTGLTFYFKINDVPIFMKGSNWIPVDSFLDRVTKSRLQQLLDSAVYVNMNSIRIWGGGVYESDEFYDIADELGILIWQDLMFACSMYPTDSDFLRTVTDEITYQIKRLSHHPSVVAWTANNENEGALVDNWYGTAGVNYDLYKQDYVRLYVDTIRSAVLAVDPDSRPFLSSSPTNGLVTENNGWISEDPRPSSPNYGDVHYYNYNDDCLDYNIYPLTRYASEYGYQSWPSYHTLKTVADDKEDLFYGSAFWRHREHHEGAGNGTDNIIRRHFIWPSTQDIYGDFRNYIYLSQVAQAICYQSQTEFYRRSRSNPNAMTMGALYWQHNDIWQAPSWSTIDYNGNWKMAHYFARRFFADPIVSLVNESSNVAAYTVTDHLTAVNQVHLVLQLWTWGSQLGNPLYQWTLTVDVQPEGSFKVFEKPTADLLAEGSCPAPEQCLLTVYIEDEDGQHLSPTNSFYFVSWKDAVGILDPKLSVARVDQIDAFTFSVTVRSSAVAVFTWLEAVDISGHFSDNGFLITSSETTVTFHAWQSITANGLASSITLKSLYDTLPLSQSSTDNNQ